MTRRRFHAKKDDEGETQYVFLPTNRSDDHERGRKMKRRFLSIVILLFVSMIFLTWATSISLAADKPKPINLTFSVYVPATHFWAELAKQWSDEIEKRTNGQIKVTTFPGGSLLKSQNAIDGVISGVADIAHGGIPHLPGRFPLFELMNYPLGAESAKALHYTQKDLWKKFHPKEFDEVKLLCLDNCSPSNVWSKKPIRTVDDFKGLKLRTAGSGTDAIKALGAIPVAVALSSEVYEMLAKGIVDGHASSLNNLVGYHEDEVTHYLTMVPLNCYNFYTVMNKKKWESLPDNIKKIIDDWDDEYQAIAADRWNEEVPEGLAYAKAKGMEIIYFSPEELAKFNAILEPIAGAYVKKVEAKGIKEIGPFYEETKRLLPKYNKLYPAPEVK